MAVLSSHKRPVMMLEDPLEDELVKALESELSLLKTAFGRFMCCCSDPRAFSHSGILNKMEDVLTLLIDASVKLYLKADELKILDTNVRADPRLLEQAGHQLMGQIVTSRRDLDTLGRAVGAVRDGDDVSSLMAKLRAAKALIKQSKIDNIGVSRAIA